MPSPAPDPLALVQQFVNTYDTEDDREDLDSPAALKAWFLARDLIPDACTVGAADLERARTTREALRAMLLTNCGEPANARAAETVNEAAARAALTLQFDADGGSSLRPSAPGVDGAIGTILSVVFASMADGTWTRLKACPEETCRVAFYDSSKNRSKRWCSMEVCGNRTKVRAYRNRRLGPS
jgi:predicted RNA-binding Zn ribbon-like protein